RCASRRRSWASSTSRPTPSPTADAISTMTGPSPTASNSSTPAPTSSMSEASRRGRGPSASMRTKSCAASCPSSVSSPPPARESLAAGAHIINDVSAGQSDPTMLDLAAESAAPIVLMHWRGYLDQASATFHYDDVVAEVITELRTRIDEAIAVGVDPANIIVDPGLGFSKNAEHNWQILAALDEFAGLDHRLLVAASRKRFISSLISPEDPKLAEQTAKDQATATISALSAQAGAWAVRVHDPATS